MVHFWSIVGRSLSMEGPFGLGRKASYGVSEKYQKEDTIRLESAMDCPGG